MSMTMMLLRILSIVIILMLAGSICQATFDQTKFAACTSTIIAMVIAMASGAYASKEYRNFIDNYRYKPNRSKQ